MLSELPAPQKADPTHEPLAALARFSFDWAASLCDPGMGCTAYHRGWSMVRLLESDGARPAGEAFFTEQLRLAGQGNRRRVLLSGAADTGLASLVLHALRPIGVEPEIVMIDLCRTTLEQNRLFALYQGFDIDLHQGDVATLRAAPVDAVMVHSFIGFIAPEHRATMVRLWADTLRPGGRLLISHRLGRSESGTRPTPAPEAIAARRERLEVRAAAFGLAQGMRDEIGAAAEALWKIRAGHPLMTEDELLSMLDAAGLVLDRLEYDSTSRSTSPFAMREVAESRARAEIVAIKP